MRHVKTGATVTVRCESPGCTTADTFDAPGLASVAGSDHSNAMRRVKASMRAAGWMLDSPRHGDLCPNHASKVRNSWRLRGFA